MKDFLKTSDLTPAGLSMLLELAQAFKRDPLREHQLLRGETVTLYFNKPSTRTRISFETAIARLGGTPIAVGAGDLQLGRGETIEDTARTISRYSKAFVVRTFDDDDVERFAAAATIPVINALTDLHHPCQSLADVLTLREYRGYLTQCKIAYVGDGNNVVHSLMQASALCGARLSIATPADHAPSEAIRNETLRIASETGAIIDVGTDPVDAVRDADAVYTDVWVSMGDSDDENARRFEVFKEYQVNGSLMGHARTDAIFMHCLPDHRGEEVTADVVDGPQSVVFDQAENRLHTSVAILSALLTNSLDGM
jgi:ornithine carbamoyltransferase